MGHWIDKQLNNAKERKNIQSNNDVYKKWNEFVEEYNIYFLNNKEKWQFTLNKVKDYIEINECRPRESSNDPNIKKMAKWISHQQNNANKRTQIMKFDIQYNNWIEFVNQYKILFDE